MGAAASPFDAFGPGGAGTRTTVTNTVTPTKQSGIAFASEGMGTATGPTTGVGSGFLFDNTPYTGGTDGGQLNNGDGWQHYFYNSASEITFTWDQANSSSYMEARAIAFASGSESSQVTQPPQGI